MKKNLLILVCDSLRYDVGKLWDFDRKYDTRVIKAGTPAQTTIEGTSTILTGQTPEEHGVRQLGDKLEEETIFDFNFWTETELYAKVLKRDMEIDSRLKGSLPYLLDLPLRQELKPIQELAEPWFVLKPFNAAHICKRHVKEVDDWDDPWINPLYLDDFDERYYLSMGITKEQVRRWTKLVDPSKTQVLITGDHGELLQSEVWEMYKNNPDEAKSHAISHPKVHTIPMIPVPDWEEIPDEMDITKLYDMVKKNLHGR